MDFLSCSRGCLNWKPRRKGLPPLLKTTCPMHNLLLLLPPPLPARAACYSGAAAVGWTYINGFMHLYKVRVRGLLSSSCVQV